MECNCDIYSRRWLSSFQIALILHRHLAELAIEALVLVPDGHCVIYLPAHMVVFILGGFMLLFTLEVSRPTFLRY